MTVTLGLPEVGLAALVLAALQFLVSLWVSERLKASLQKEHAEFLEKLKWGSKAREQAAHVAEYLAFVRYLSDKSPETDFRRANQMSWELAIWLPEDVYREMTRALVNPGPTANDLTTVLAVRRLLLGNDAGNLCSDDIAHHAVMPASTEAATVTPDRPGV
ncbi:MAG: hypothetical protein ACYCXR_08000 [Coriobacteriia bacterium]